MWGEHPQTSGVLNKGANPQKEGHPQCHVIERPEGL